MLGNEEPKTFPTQTEAEIQSVDALKSSLTNPPILVLPLENGQNIIDNNAYDTQVGCVLLRTQHGGTD